MTQMIQWLFFFYVYCFFGWCFESGYVFLKTGHPVNRGFMRGPFLPLYGSGAIMMLVVSRPFQEAAFPQNLVLTYIAGCLGATVLEYVTGVTMEALFKIRYWDYSRNKFNFQGHICLGSSLAWGFLTIFMTGVIHRPIAQAVAAIPGGVLTVVTLVLTAAIGADFALSFKAALDLRDVLDRLEKAREEMARVQKRVDVIVALLNDDLSKRREELQAGFTERKEELQAGFAERKEELQAELSELRQRYHMHLADRERLSGMRDFFQRDMIRANPTMMSGRFGESLRELQEKLEQERAEKRRNRKQEKK
ncbi:MAG: hypothetical protein K2H41_12165 [Acetatifactor sp.]|nr:hypothetical protein [Acetatifactor sp.]